ncbi:MAG: branched-chain amino acid ABC transporter permease [Rhodocyclales bacterium]|nr:branched-chain amino acid ABC transporter permease [Rhodocyclales bacterium]
MNPTTIIVFMAGALLGALPAFESPFAQSMALTCLMYAGLAVSWSMFSGPTRYLSLATSAFFGLGAYCTAWGLGKLPWPAVVMLGGCAAVVFAFLIGLITLRLRGAYFAVITYGLGELVKHTITHIEKTYFGTVGRVMTETPSSATVYWTVLAIAALAVWTYVAFGRSRFGHALRGIGMDEERAATMGVNPMRVKLIGFCLSSWFAGALGAAMAVRWTYIDPHTVFNPFIVFQTVLISMVGGPLTVGGPLIGALGFSLLSEYLRLSLPYLYMIILGVLLIASVLYLPDGIAGYDWKKQWGKIMRRKEQAEKP